MLKNFKEFANRCDDYGYPTEDWVLRKFCESEWPTFGVDWPSEGMYDWGIAAAVQDIVYGYGGPGHPDQIPYIQVWVDILDDNPDWLRACRKGCRPKGKGKETAVLAALGGARPRC